MSAILAFRFALAFAFLALSGAADGRPPGSPVSPAVTPSVSPRAQPVGTNRVVSVRADGRYARKGSQWSATSETGRYVAFASRAGKLLDPPMCRSDDLHLYWRDRRSGANALIDARPDGRCSEGSIGIGRPSISGDGRYVAFTSWSIDISPIDQNDRTDVFVRDVTAGTTRVVSLSIHGGTANNHSQEAEISADGSTVVFSSAASDLVPNMPPVDPFQDYHVYRHDLATGVTTLVSQTPEGEYPNGGSSSPSVSGDGSLVAFATLATDIVPGAPGGFEVVLCDVETRSSTPVSRPPTGHADGGSFVPSISADGTTIAFSSKASNLVPGDTNGTYDVFVHRIAAEETSLVSRGRRGGAANGYSESPETNGDGTLVVFTSEATNLVPRDDNRWSDAFVHDTRTSTTTIVSRTRSGSSGNWSSSDPSVSGDGSLVTFTSLADDLVRHTPRGPARVYAYRTP